MALNAQGPCTRLQFHGIPTFHLSFWRPSWFQYRPSAIPVQIMSIYSYSFYVSCETTGKYVIKTRPSTKGHNSSKQNTHL